MSDLLDLRRRDLARHLGRHTAAEVRFDVAARKLYATDASIYQIEPLGVVLPRSVEDVRAVVQVLAEAEVPVTARGGGTSLSGQSIGPGVILDCSKYLNAIHDLDPTARTARVQPGVVLDQLNRAAAAHGLTFGPDVSTANRANLGGMIGNNSAGSRSIVHGKTIDHVRALSVVLADGRATRFEPLTPDEWALRAGGRHPDAPLYAGTLDVARRNADEVRRRFPRILRRVSGYNLDVFAEALCPEVGARASRPQEERAGRPRSQDVGLHHLIVGSEGTLGVVTEAELGLVPLPKCRGLLVPQFDSLAAAMDALAPCLELGPSAVELLDALLIELSAGNLALRDTMKFLHGRPQAVFMVEFSGDDPAEVADKVEKLRRRLESSPGVTATVPALDKATRDPLWDLRRAAMPLLYSMPGDAKPVTFVEDTAVPPARLPEYVARFRELLRRHGTDGAFYGHASVGCLHIRPVLNLKDRSDVARMRRIAEEVAALVVEFGGSLSGEHGDGLARSELLPRLFGPQLYEAFREVKRLFDPRGLLNPGKVVDAPRMDDNLRYPPGYRPVDMPAVFDYSKQEGLVRSVEMCNGSGACRKTQGGTMCPSYRATRDEADSTRGRANGLRHVLAEGAPIHQRWLFDVFDLCLMCKACKAECPSNVDVAKLKAEFLQAYYRHQPRPLGHYLMAGLPTFNRWAAPFAPLVNFLQRRKSVRWLLERFAGIDRRRTLPPLHRRHFRRWLARHRPAAGAGRKGRVLLLADCFTTYNEPQVGRAAVRLLERAGYAVGLADASCCGRVLLSKGMLDRARDLAAAGVASLARQLRGGDVILGLEPSCLLALADEWPELVPGPEAQAVAAAARLADGWLAEQVGAGRAELTLTPREGRCLLHGHCHQKALVGVGGSVAALKLVPGLEVEALDAGCCGMAGSFGYEAEHYDLSVKIANLALLPALAAAPDAEVAATGTSCRHQVADLARRRARHPLEIVAAQLPPAGGR
jgi:FAD/FMN-containing dehydrogenase/Fe-S oxidoreductase